MTFECSFDNTTGDLQMTSTVDGAGMPQLQATGVPTSTDNRIVVSVFRTKVCGVTVQ